jgi:O-antigen ligase
MDQERLISPLPATRDPRKSHALLSKGGILLVFLLTIAASHVLLSRLGVQMFAFTLVGLFVGTIYTVLSFRNLVFPFIVVILSVGGFRFLWSVKAPVLPDLYLDRIMILWFTAVFMVKVVAEGRKLRGPFTLDVLIFLHGLYVYVRVAMFDNVFLHTWSMCILVPYAVYFFAKNSMYEMRAIRMLLIALLVLNFYYCVTSIAEKFDIAWLLFPRDLIHDQGEYIGRSCGPFRNPGIFGNSLGMLMTINLYFMSQTRANWLKLLLGANLGFSMLALYFTYTRGSWLAGITCLGVVAVMNYRHYLRPLLPLLALAPILAISFLGVGNDDFMQERVENDDTIGARVGTAVTALRVWRDNPFLGCGSFRYRQVREDYLAPVEVPGMPKIRMVQFRRNAIHDMYLGPLAEDGLVGMGLQFAIFFFILKTLLAKYRVRGRGEHFGRFIVPLFAGIFVAYLVGGLAMSFRNVSMMGGLLYLGAGIAAGYRPEDDPTADQYRKVE